MLYLFCFSISYKSQSIHFHLSIYRYNHSSNALKNSPSIVMQESSSAAVNSTLDILNDLSKFLSLFNNDRSINITQIITSVSGDPISINGFIQNKGLQWILHGDQMNLAYNSSHLVQRYALMVFFYSLSDENWSSKVGFMSEIHECEWFVIDINAQGHVDLIDMNCNNLHGKLPSEMTTFSRLEKLLLFNNYISGSIPS